MQKKDLEYIKSALHGARWLISNEYESVIDEELRKEYDQVLKELENAIELVRK